MANQNPNAPHADVPAAKTQHDGPADVAAVTAHPMAGAHDDAHGHHPTPGTYIKIGLLLTLITVAEVWAYYIPALVASRAFVPMLLIMSAVKFVIVVMFYMHLKYDHKLFRALFTGPFLIAAVTLLGLMFLFGKASVRLGLLN